MSKNIYWKVATLQVQTILFCLIALLLNPKHGVEFNKINIQIN